MDETSTTDLHRDRQRADPGCARRDAPASSWSRNRAKSLPRERRIGYSNCAIGRTASKPPAVNCCRPLRRSASVVNGAVAYRLHTASYSLPCCFNLSRVFDEHCGDGRPIVGGGRQCAGTATRRPRNWRGRQYADHRSTPADRRTTVSAELSESTTRSPVYRGNARRFLRCMRLLPPRAGMMHRVFIGCRQELVGEWRPCHGRSCRAGVPARIHCKCGAKYSAARGYGCCFAPAWAVSSDQEALAVLAC